MTGELEPLPEPVSPAAPGAGPAMLAAELLGRVRVDLPVVGELGEREQVLVAARLTWRRPPAHSGLVTSSSRTGATLRPAVAVGVPGLIVGFSLEATGSPYGLLTFEVAKILNRTNRRPLRTL